MAGDIVVVLSDLHMGAGRFAEGNTLEDFSSDAAFASLLESVAKRRSNDPQARRRDVCRSTKSHLSVVGE